MDSEKLLELYHEHYKETNELSKEAQKRRNKSIVILCVLEAISFMLIYNPDLIFEPSATLWQESSPFGHQGLLGRKEGVFFMTKRFENIRLPFQTRKCNTASGSA